MRLQAGPQTVNTQAFTHGPYKHCGTEGFGMGIPEGAEGWSIRVQWGTGSLREMEEFCGWVRRWLSNAIELYALMCEAGKAQEGLGVWLS